MKKHYSVKNGRLAVFNFGKKLVSFEYSSKTGFSVIRLKFNKNDYLLASPIEIGDLVSVGYTLYHVVPKGQSVNLQAA